MVKDCCGLGPNAQLIPTIITTLQINLVNQLLVSHCHRHKELDHQNKGSQYDSLAKKNSSGPAKDKIKQNNKNNNNLKLVLALQPGQ